MINQAYLQKETIKQMSSYFKQNEPLPHIMLPNFLEQKDFINIQKEGNKLSFLNKNFPDKENKQIAKISKKSLINSFSSNPELIKMIKKIISKNQLEINWQIEKYQHKSYTIRSDEQDKIKYMFILELTNSWNKAAGGQVTITPKDKDPLILPVQTNSFTIIKIEKSEYFTKYVNNLSNKNKIIRLIGTI